MTLREKAVLEIDLPDGESTKTGVFTLREGLSNTTETTRSFLMSARGQYIRRIWDIGSDLLPDEVVAADDLENRRGYHVDGGAGTVMVRLSGRASKGDQWGDDSAAAGEYNRYDATDAHPVVMQQVLDWYLSQARTDSQAQARLHIGEWTDGTYTDGGDAGVFGGPLVVAIESATVGREEDDPGGVTVTLELVWTAAFPDVDVVGAAEGALEEIGDWIQDF